MPFLGQKRQTDGDIAGLMSDMGILRVEVMGAKNLMAGDRSGKSDVCFPVFLLPVGGEELMIALRLL